MEPQSAMQWLNFTPLIFSYKYSLEDTIRDSASLVGGKWWVVVVGRGQRRGTGGRGGGGAVEDEGAW